MRLLKVLVVGALAALAITGLHRPATAQEPGLDRLVTLLSDGSVSLIGATGSEIGSRRRGTQPPEPIAEAEIVRLLAGVQLSAIQAKKVWGALGDPASKPLLTLPIVQALITASASPAGHEALWKELAAVAEGKRGPAKSLVAFFTKHRQKLLPLLRGVAETEDCGDAMADLLETSNILGERMEDGVRWVGVNHPAALARRMEDERGHGPPVQWEQFGFEQLLAWKERHFGARGTERPTTLAGLNADSAIFIIIFNNLHALDESYRRRMLAGITPVEAFSIVVGGEYELYRLGTSGYRNFLHPLIMRGVAESGSFEAFLTKTARSPIGELRQADVERRGMVFLRIVSAFALLEPVLATVRDRSRFVDSAVKSLTDPETLESSASVVLDILNGRSKEAVTLAFRRELLDHLYGLHSSEQDVRLKSVIGSVLSVYQRLTNDRRDTEVERLYPIDRSLTEVSFDDLFSPDGDGGHVHRMFMRLADDADAKANFEGFRATMSARGAEAFRTANYEAYRIKKKGRAIEIYLNRPSEGGLTTGLDDLGKLLDGVRVHTVIGRGHTAIITPLRADSAKLLGPFKSGVAVVIVGACGGSASVRELVDTFGYRTIMSTRATGRQVINSAVIESYLTMLFALSPGDRLDMNAVLGKAVGPFLSRNSGEALREDARFYQINTASVYAAMLLDRHVKGTPVAEALPQAAADGSVRLKLIWSGRASENAEKPVRNARKSGGDDRANRDNSED